MNMSMQEKPAGTFGDRIVPGLQRDVSGFTLVEMLVVIGIIALLIGLLMPVLSRVRAAGDRTKSMSVINNIATAVQSYHMQFRAYPGVYGNAEVRGEVISGIRPNGFNTNGPTSSENLVLALSGGLMNNSGTFTYNKDLLGTGPQNFKTGKQYPPFAEGLKMTSGQLATGTLQDTPIPEYEDGYGDNSPVLYMRANVGNKGIAADDLSAQYDASSLYLYTRQSIPTGGSHGLQALGTDTEALKKTGTNNARPYLRSPVMTATPTARNADTFILIGAGPDRLFGTADDITNFGDVMP